jgi:hypothetical protein
MKRIRKIDGSCAPLALKYLSGMTDREVCDICQFYGFQQDTGMEEHEFIEAAKDMGIRLRRINLKKKELYRVKLRKFIRENNSGTFLIYTHAHLFVIDDGKIIDPLNEGYYGLDRLVTGAWKSL